jgi:hypothetical protein
MLFNFKYELERRCPKSIIEIDCEEVDNKMLRKKFMTLKSCVDFFIWLQIIFRC